LRARTVIGRVEAFRYNKYMVKPIMRYHVGGIAKKGRAIYQKIKDKYEPHYNGKFLAIDPKTGAVYMGNTLDEAYDVAHSEQLNASFYLLRIGYPSVGTLNIF
jgi:hypothetical protein